METLAIFNGSHTLQNTRTGQHRTFLIKTIQQGKLKGKRVVALLTGPDNTADYTRFAFVGDDGRIHVWRKFRGQNKRSAWDWYAIMLEMVVIQHRPQWQENGQQYGPYEHLLEGRCARCNRKLTHPDSAKAGIGPECASRVNT